MTDSECDGLKDIIVQLQRTIEQYKIYTEELETELQQYRIYADSLNETIQNNICKNSART